MSKGNIQLRVLRARHGMTQTEAAAACGFSRSLWGEVEKGNQQGSHKFWSAIQTTFQIPDAEMWQLMKGGEDL
jgi:DNA-binding XRE family transcriptional regulator